MTSTTEIDSKTEQQVAELRKLITPLHVERGQQMRQIVQADIARRGYSFHEAADALALELGISSETVELAIAIANDA